MVVMVHFTGALLTLYCCCEVFCVVTLIISPKRYLWWKVRRYIFLFFPLNIYLVLIFLDLIATYSQSSYQPGELFLSHQSGLLKFRAVAEPRNSGIFAKSREIDKNTWNTAKFARNSTKYMSVQHIWNLSWLLELFTCRKLANLSWNFVTATSKHRTKTTRRS